MSTLGGSGVTAGRAPAGQSGGWDIPGGPADQWHRPDTQSQPQPSPGFTRPLGIRSLVLPYRIENRNWGDFKKLDVTNEPEGYLVWRDRALAHLSKDRPDVKDLLLWSVKQSTLITEAREAEGARHANL